MKKVLVISTLAMALASGTAFAQGFIAFANSSTTLVTVDASGAAKLGLNAGDPVPKGNVCSAGLYYAPDAATAPDASAFQLVGTGTPFSNLSAGRYNGGSVAIPGVAGGSSAWFQVRVWESALGDYNNAVVNGGVAGASGMFKLATGAITPTPLTSAGGVSSFQVSVVPEPSALALGLLGLAGLFIIRRRQ